MCKAKLHTQGQGQRKQIIVRGLNNGQRERSERQHRGPGGQKLLFRGGL